MAIIIQRPTLILKDEPNTIRISRAAIKAIPIVSAHPYFKKVRNWKHIAVHYLSVPENQHEVILFDGTQTEPEGILEVSPKAHNIFVLEAIVLHDFDNGWLTIPKELITEANDMELAFDSRYRQPNIDAVIQNDNQGLITWDAAKETDSNTIYILSRKENGGAYSVLSTITGVRTYLDQNLEADVTYTYKVEIDDITKYIPPTDSASIKPVRPAAPINLRATTTPGQVTTTWSPIPQAGVTYNLYRSEISGAFTTPIASGLTGNSYIDNTVVGGMTYYYIVKSVKTFESLPSNQVTIKPIGIFNITNIIPTSTTSARVEWGISAGADSYNLFYKNITAASYTQITGAVSPRDITGLTEGETYQFYVTAINPYSSYTTPIDTETMPKTAGIPTNFTASQWLDGVVKLKWNTTSDADTYWLYRSLSQNGIFTKIATVNGLSYDDTAVTNGINYYYKLSAINLHEGLEIEGLKTGAINGFPNKIIATITKSSGASTTKTPITYSAYTNAPAGIVTKIEIKHFDKNGSLLSTFNSSSGVSSYTATTLQLNLYTEFAAYATMYVSNSDGSQVVQSSTLYYITAANIPSMRNYSSTFDDVTVNWQAGPGNDSYILYRSSNTQMTNAVEKYSGSLLTFTDNTVSAGVPYYFAVKGVVNNGTWSGITIGINPPPTSLQSEPSSLSASMVASRRVYNRPEPTLNIYGSQYRTDAAPYSRTGVSVSYGASSEYYNNIKILRSTDKANWNTPSLIAGGWDINVLANTVYYYKVEATEIRTGTVFSKIFGIHTIDATYTAINLSGSISWAPITQCVYDGNDQRSYKMYRVSFSWNKNPAGASFREFDSGSTNSGSSTHPFYAVGSNSTYMELSPDQYQRDSNLVWYRVSYVDGGGTTVKGSGVTAFNSARSPNGSSWYAWYYGPLTKIPC